MFLPLAFSPISLILLVALVLVILYLVRHLLSKKDRPREAGLVHSEPDLSSLGIVDARHGDTVSVVGRGDEFDDLDFVVDRRNRYQGGSSTWYEVSGRYRGRRVYIEWYDDDELEVVGTLRDCDLTLADLGLTEQDLIRMDESQSRSEGFEHDGARFRYEDSGEIGYFRDGQGEGEGYYNWDFVEEGGDRLVFIEKWEDDPFEVGIATRIPPGDIRVFRS